MTRPFLNLMIDALAACLFLGMVATGLVLNWVLPPGTNKSLVLWSLSRHQWGAVHAWVSLALLLCLGIHIALHWTWVVTVVRRELGIESRRNRPIRAAVLAVIVLGMTIGLFAWAAETSVYDRPDPRCEEAEVREVAGTTKTSVAAAKPTWAEVKSLLRASCLECHGPTLSRGGFRVDLREDFVNRDQQRPLVIPGDSRNSPLIAIVSGRRPDVPFPDRHHLRDADIETLARWIDGGALGDKSAE